MIELLCAVLVGILIGVISGLIPGLHPNTLIPIILGLSFAFQNEHLVIALTFAGVINSFVSFIPAILLGSPEDDTALSVLPGHRLLFEGRAYEAVKLTVLGGMFSLFISLLLLPLLVLFISSFYTSLRPYVWLALIFVLFHMLLTEKRSKLDALCVVLFSASLGLIVLQNFGSLMLFPMLTGLFGLPILFLNAIKGVKLPKKISFECETLRKRDYILSSFSGAIAGILVGLLPGIGSAQASVMVHSAIERGRSSIRNFLIAIGGINTSDIVYSIFALWLIGNPRSGVAAAIGRLIEIVPQDLLYIIVAVLIASLAGALLTVWLLRKSIDKIIRFDYRKLCALVFALVMVLIFIFTGLHGVVISFVGMAIGLIALISGVRRSHAMACLIVPTILYFI